MSWPQTQSGPAQTRPVVTSGPGGAPHLARRVSEGIKYTPGTPQRCAVAASPTSLLPPRLARLPPRHLEHSQNLPGSSIRIPAVFIPPSPLPAAPSQQPPVRWSSFGFRRADVSSCLPPLTDVCGSVAVRVPSFLTPSQPPNLLLSLLPSL